MRLLHVTPYYKEAWAYGGIPRVATALCEALAARGHVMTVYTTDVRDATRRRPNGAVLAAPFEHEVDGVRVVEFSNLSNRAAYHLQAYAPLGLTRWLRAELGSFDVVHIHGHHHLLSVAAARACLDRHVPYVVQPNGTAPRIERRIALKWLFDRVLGSHVLRGAAAVIGVSEAERAQLRGVGVPESKIRIIGNPVEALENRGTARSRLVVYVGKITPRKQVDTLVDAMALLGDDVSLIIAGSDMGGLARVHARIAHHRLHERVRLMGLLRDEERAKLLSSADVLAYPGGNEVFGLVAFEAILCGAPVVVADDSGCGEVVRQIGGGLLVPPGDSERLAGAIEAILTNKSAWTTRIDAAGATIRSEYSKATIAERVERLYTTVLERR